MGLASWTAVLTLLVAVYVIGAKSLTQGPDPITRPAQLGRLTAMDVATIKGVIDRLTARGLTETGADPTDGRRLLVRLTRLGQQTAEKAAPNAVAITKETLAPLDAKEREALIALLSKLR